jgi:hypothetical protein
MPRSPAIDNIFQQLNDLKRQIAVAKAKPPPLQLPEYITTPGDIKYPMKKPVPFYKTILMKPQEGNTFFGLNTNTYYGEYQVSDQDPTYLVRISASLELMSGEGAPIGAYRMLSPNMIQDLTNAEFWLKGFKWRFLQDETVRNIVPGWLPSTELVGWNRDRPGLVLPVQWEMKKGEALNFQAKSNAAQDYGFDLRFHLECIKMLDDANAIVEALEE